VLTYKVLHDSAPRYLGPEAAEGNEKWGVKVGVADKSGGSNAACGPRTQISGWSTDPLDPAAPRPLSGTSYRRRWPTLLQLKFGTAYQRLSQSIGKAVKTFRREFWQFLLNKLLNPHQSVYCKHDWYCVNFYMCVKCTKFNKSDIKSHTFNISSAVVVQFTYERWDIWHESMCNCMALFAWLAVLVQYRRVADGSWMDGRTHDDSIYRASISSCFSSSNDAVVSKNLLRRVYRSAGLHISLSY